MAITSLGTGGGVGDKTPASRQVLTISPGWSTNEWVVIAVAMDNQGTTTGETSQLTEVRLGQDNASESATKLVEFTLGGTAETKSTIAIWVKKANNTSTQLYLFYSPGCTAKAVTIWRYSAAGTLTLDVKGTRADDGLDPGSISLTPSQNREHLAVRAVAGETNSTTALTPTSGWTAMDAAQSSGGGAGANMAARAEFRILTTGSAVASDPTWISAENASAMVLLYEQGGGSTVTGSVTADAYIKSTISGSFTADAYVKRLDLTGSFTGDAFIKKLDQPGSFTADAYLATTTSASFTANAWVKGTVSASVTADAYLKRLDQPGSFTADAYLKRLDQPGSLTADAYLKRLDQPGSLTADAYISKTQTGSFVADAYLRTTVSSSLTADSHIKATISSSLVADAYVKRTGLTGSLTSDAYIAATQSGSFVADAYIQRTTSASLTADAYLQATIAGNLTANAHIKSTLSGSFTADAYLLRTTSASLTADAYIKAIQSASVTADAHIGRVARVYWTTPTDGELISATPELRFRVPRAIGPVHFYLQLDTVNTFNSGNLREYRSSRDQAGWEYWNGTTWVAVPASGVPTTYEGNEARFTVPTALAAGTWYRRIAAGA